MAACTASISRYTANLTDFFFYDRPFGPNPKSWRLYLSSWDSRRRVSWNWICDTESESFQGHRTSDVETESRLLHLESTFQFFHALALRRAKEDCHKGGGYLTACSQAEKLRWNRLSAKLSGGHSLTLHRSVTRFPVQFNPIIIMILTFF